MLPPNAVQKSPLLEAKGLGRARTQCSSHHSVSFGLSSTHHCDKLRTNDNSWKLLSWEDSKDGNIWMEYYSLTSVEIVGTVWEKTDHLWRCSSQRIGLIKPWLRHEQLASHMEESRCKEDSLPETVDQVWKVLSGVWSYSWMAFPSTIAILAG